MPVIFSGENLDVSFAEVVLGICSVLHDGGLVLSWRRLGGGKVLGVAGSSGTGRLTDVAVSARDIVGAGTGMVVYDTVDIDIFKLVLRVHQ